MTNNDLVESIRADARERVPQLWEPFALGLIFILGMWVGNLVLDMTVFSARDMFICYFSYLFGSFYMRRLWITRTNK